MYRCALEKLENLVSGAQEFANKTNEFTCWPGWTGQRPGLHYFSRQREGNVLPLYTATKKRIIASYFGSRLPRPLRARIEVVRKGQT